MIELNSILNFYPSPIASNTNFQKQILKEYIQLMVLDYLATTAYISKLAFIGGTNVRLIKGIDRFSEDIDFDCKQLTEQEFTDMTDGVIIFLQRYGLRVEARDKVNPKLTAFRRNIYFPELLFELGLTGHREERFLLKIEAQDQGVPYPIEMKYVQRCGFFFSIPTPSDSVLLSMKLSALLSRAKGRDFYDTMFLMQQTEPSYDFLARRVGIANAKELKATILQKLESTDLQVKKRDFEHLLFDIHSAEKILHFPDFINSNLT
jgi:predicted nucleotidyltransferase component of viral defense system